MSSEYEPYSPMEEPEKKDNKLLIIIAVVLVVICCCCLLISGAFYYLWTYGDQLVEDYIGFLLPYLFS